MMKNLMVVSMMVSSVAFAGDPKAGAPAAPAKDKTADAAKAEVKPEMKPAPEIAERLKSMAGTWRCTGKGEMGGVMNEKATATISHKGDLDGYWIQSNITIALPKGPPIRMTMMTTYDTASNKWFRTSASNRGGHGAVWGTTTGAKTSWEGDAHFMGDVKVRESDELVSPREIHIVGEYSKDGGKTWNLDHDVTCKK